MKQQPEVIEMRFPEECISFAVLDKPSREERG
jgi:hypothetical protein